MAQIVKNLSALQGTQVQSLGWGDHLEKGMSTHSSILASSNATVDRKAWRAAILRPKDSDIT